jgi:MSHA biogenesis protein MshO
MIEMIIVIAITGVIAAAVAVFIRRPVEGYVDAVRRAELTDIADTALRRISRDLRSALPNSIRLTAAAGVTYLEYLQMSGGGRYRAELDSAGAGDTIDFTTPAGDSTFDVIGPMPAFAGGESIVVYNLASSGAIANAYSGDNRAAWLSNTATRITLTAPRLFPFASPAKRFQVVQYPVTYECNPGAQILRRRWGYPITAAQGTPPAGGSNALLATNVTTCTFTYTEVNQRTGVVALFLQVSRDGESVRLFQEAHVNNVP